MNPEKHISHGHASLAATGSDDRGPGSKPLGLSRLPVPKYSSLKVAAVAAEVSTPQEQGGGADCRVLPLLTFTLRIKLVDPRFMVMIAFRSCK